MTNIAASPGGGEPRKSVGSLPAPTFKRGLRGFINEVMREMKKVTWPTVPETNRLTIVVLMACLAMVALLTLLGIFFETMISIMTKGH
jgi:preprotein translocase SecE subunit